jgi:hypothetical protein
MAAGLKRAGPMRRPFEPSARSKGLDQAACMHALRERGMSVPEPMGLVCFDERRATRHPIAFSDRRRSNFRSARNLSTQMLLERMSGKANYRRRDYAANGRHRSHILLR